MEQSGEKIRNQIGVVPKVSIIIPVYNVEKYIKECIDSVLNQTFDDYELILVNDGSKDKSGSICDEYADKYPNITVIHQENQGQSAARNNGVSIAKADWILFIDSDDVIHQQLLGFLYHSVKESGSSIGVCSRIEGVETPEDFFAPREFEYNVEDVTFEKLEQYYDESRYYYWAPFPSIVKKDIVIKIPFIEGRIYEDNAISCQWLYEAKNISIVPYDMYFYRQNPTGTMQRPFTAQKFDYLWALQQQIDFFVRIGHVRLASKTADNALETAFYYSSVIDKMKDRELKKKLKILTKAFLNKYKTYITFNKRVNEKIDKLLCPFKFKIKKRLGMYK